LNGQPYERRYRDGVAVDPRTTRKIQAKLDKGKSLVETVSYEVYWLSYDQELEQGVDGNLYYINGQGYLSVASGDIAVRDSMTIPSERIDKP